MQCPANLIAPVLLVFLVRMSAASEPSALRDGPSAASGAPPTLEGESYAEAWARHEAEIVAVKLVRGRDEMARLNLDLIAVGTRIEHLAGRLSPYRERIVDELPRFPVAWLDDLASLARAVIWTSLEVSAASPMHNNRTPVLAEARVLRRRLWAALATRAAFAEPDEARTPARLVRRTSAHVAVTLQSLARSLRASGLEGTPVVVGDLDRAEAVAAQLIRMSGVLDRASAERTAAVELRAKAVVLLSSRYEEIRAAVLYVGRREKGIERVVPPLGNVRIVPRKVRRRAEAVVVGAGEVAGERGGGG